MMVTAGASSNWHSACIPTSLHPCITELSTPIVDILLRLFLTSIFSERHVHIISLIFSNYYSTPLQSFSKLHSLEKYRIEWQCGQCYAVYAEPCMAWLDFSKTIFRPLPLRYFNNISRIIFLLLSTEYFTIQSLRHDWCTNSMSKFKHHVLAFNHATPHQFLCSSLAFSGY